MRKKKRQAKIRLNTWFLPALVALLLIQQLISPYRGWQILLIGLGGAWLIAYLWARSLARGLRLTREMRFGWAQVGDWMMERFTLVNDSRVSFLWAEVIDQSTLPGYEVSRGVGMSGMRSIRWYSEAACAHRGLFTLGPTTLRAGDPFGFYTVTIEYPDSLPLLVLPPIVPLPTIEVAPGGRAGDGRPRAYAVERTASAATVREYAPGDSLRWIHWPTSARRDGLFVRLFDGTPAGDWWILLDMDRFAQVGEGADATQEHGVVLAASLADRGLRAGHAVGLVAQGEELVWLPPQGGMGQSWEVLRSLALVSLGSQSLGQVLERTRPAIGQHTSLIIITPNVRTGWVETLFPLLQRGIAPTVLLLDPVSFGGISKASSTASLLADIGVANYVIDRDLLDRPEARPGQREPWKWQDTQSDRTIPASPPANASWRVVSR